MSDNENETTLTAQEEQRFAELFTANDRLELTHDWKRVLSNAITAEGLSPSGSEDTVLELDGYDAPVVDLAAERGRRRSPGLLLAMAAAAVLIVGFGAIVALGSGDENQIQEVALLGPDREIDPPAVSSMDLPDSTVLVVEADDRAFVLREVADSGETTVFVGDGTAEWAEVATLAVTDAAFASDGNHLALAGASPAGLVDRPGVSGVFEATELVIFVSTDAGMTWTASTVALPEPKFPNAGEDVPDGSFVTADEVSVAVSGDATVVSYTTALQYDFTDAARELGLIGSEDRIVRFNDGLRNIGLFAVGPDSFGQVDIQPEDIGLPRHAYDDLVIAPQTPQSHVLVSETGADFVPVESLQSQRHIEPVIAADELGFYYVGATDWVRVYRSENGVEWNLINVDELSEAFAETIEVTPDWTVGFDVAAGQVTQSVEGGRFVPVPAPAAGLTVGGVVETDFGVAIVWQDFTAVASAITEATTVHDGYTVERNFQGAFTVTDPNGVVLIEERGDTVTPEGGVVIDTEGNMQVFDQNGQRQLLVEPEDLFGVAATVTGSQYVGWSTDGEDWKYAALEQPAGPWVFGDTPNGLFGVNALDLEQSLVIDWPAEFSG